VILAREFGEVKSGTFIQSNIGSQLQNQPRKTLCGYINYIWNPSWTFENKFDDPLSVPMFARKFSDQDISDEMA
jgi:hypothetical protein